MTEFATLEDFRRHFLSTPRSVDPLAEVDERLHSMEGARALLKQQESAQRVREYLAANPPLITEWPNARLVRNVKHYD